MPDTSHSLRFRKSSYSGATTQNCVEIADTDDGAAVRDTQNRSLGHVEFPAAEWNAFLADVKRRRL